MQARTDGGSTGIANATVQTVSYCDLLILWRDDFDAGATNSLTPLSDTAVPCTFPSPPVGPLFPVLREHVSNIVQQGDETNRRGSYTRRGW